MRFVFLFSLALLLPLSPAWAAVSISEIAWMGTTVSANDEWIELHNTGSAPVSVDGWQITDNDSLTILLTGTIAPGAYVVLERTDDTSAPGPAFLTYTGALRNDGTTLTLQRSDGSVVETLVGGTDWERIGGSNETKDTAQRTSSGWVTAPATAGAAPVSNPTPTPTNDPESAESERSEDSASEANDDSDDSPSTRTRRESSSGEAKTLTLPDVTLTLSVPVPERVFVGQPLSLSVAASGHGRSWLNSLRYQWSFGDGGSARGQHATHTYAYPGEYVLTVRAAYARHEVLFKEVVTVLPRRFSIERNQAGDVLLHNDTPYEVDVSGFTLQGRNTFTFPPHTYLVPRGTLTLPASELEAQSDAMLALYDPTGSLVASNFSALTESVAPRSSVLASASEVVETPYRAVSPRQLAGSPGAARVEAAPAALTAPDTPPTVTTPSPIPPSTTVATRAPSGTLAAASVSTPLAAASYWPYLLLGVTILLGLIGLHNRPKPSAPTILQSGTLGAETTDRFPFAK